MRIVLARVAEARWVIVTPDGDVYTEDFGQHNGDITGMRMLKEDGSLPAGLRNEPIYRWRPGGEPVGDDLLQLFEEGRQLAALEGGGGPLPRAAPMTWVFAEAGDQVERGDPVGARHGVFLDNRGESRGSPGIFAW